MNFILPEWMPNIHPLILHFPIVLLILAVLLHLTALIVWKLPWLRTTTLVVSVLGLLTLIVLSNCKSKGEIIHASFKVDGMSIRGGIL